MRRKRSTLEKVSGAVVKAVAGVPPGVATLRLAALAAEEPPGLRRRALLAARIAVMRKALDAPEPEVEVAVAPPEPPEPEPVVEPPPVVKAPKPLSKGVMMSINLDDVARMLSAPVEEAPAPAPEPEPEVVVETMTPPPMPDPAALFAALDWEGSAARLDPGEVPGMAGGDDATCWDQWPTQTAVEDTAPVAAVAEEPAAPVKRAGKRPKVGMAVADAGAAFAALEAAEPAAPPGKPKPLAIDLSAQFAAMDGSDDAA